MIQNAAAWSKAPTRPVATFRFRICRSASSVRCPAARRALASPSATKSSMWRRRAHRSTDLPRGGAGRVAPHSQSPHVARPEGLVGAATRAVARAQHRTWRREAAPASHADGASGDLVAGRHTEFHRFLCLGFSRHQCRAHVPPGQSADAELQICAGRLSQPGLLDPRQRHRRSSGRAASASRRTRRRRATVRRAISTSSWSSAFTSAHRASLASPFRSAGRPSIFSGFACSTTGRRATCRPGNTSRSVRSSARILPPPFRPGW